MLIANPIYDVTFKYLMQHNHAAKLLISAILEMPVLELEFKPQEFSTKVHDFSVYRVDFKAKIQTHDGNTMMALIELQKIKLHSSTFRFRKYLGEQYSSEENMEGNNPLPLITIYILGHYLTKLKKIPIIKVKRQYLAHGTNEVLEVKEPFIEALTHDCIIIQLPALKRKKEKTKLEKILSIFELSRIHSIEIEDDKYPQDFKEILKILGNALLDQKTKKTMEIEDEILEELKLREERRLRLERQWQAKLSLKEKELEEKDKELEEKDKELEEKDKELEEKDKELEEKNKQLEENKHKLKETAKMLKELGVDISIIIQKTGLTEEEVRSV